MDGHDCTPHLLLHVGSSFACANTEESGEGRRLLVAVFFSNTDGLCDLAPFFYLGQAPRIFDKYYLGQLLNPAP